MDFKISVVVCTYNRSDILKHCLDSLVDQKVESSSFEVIVVDNNSSDDTKKVVKEYCAKYSNFRYVFEKEQGHSQARNRGWKEADGEIIAYIDDDAVASEKWIESVINCFSETDAEMVGGPIISFFNENDTDLSDYVIKKSEFKDFGNERRKLEWPENRCGFPTGNVAYKKNVFYELEGFSEEFGLVNGKLVAGEDSEFNLRISLAGKHVWFEPEAKVHHRIHGELKTIKGILKRKWSSGFGMGKIYYIHFSFFKFVKKIPSIFYHFFIFVLFSPLFFKREKSLDNLGYAIYDVALIASWLKMLFER